MRQDEHTIVILGAGLAGSCTALELAHRGFTVTLVDQDELPMNRASLRNEGKIHLGLCYANDRSLETAALQLRGALTFRNLLSRWLGERANALSVSTPFVYAVSSDSLLDADELAHQYQAIDKLYHEMIQADSELNYFGMQPARLFHRLDSSVLQPHFNLDRIQAGFMTEELAIDPSQLAVSIRKALDDSPNISFTAAVRILEVARSAKGFSINGIRDGSDWRATAEQVVNATWEGRIAIDQGMGIFASTNWLHRLKYRVIAQLPERLEGGPSVTMVLGKYGDVVVRPDGSAYLSWYPLGLKGWTNDVSPPRSWDRPCRGEVDESEGLQIGQGIVDAIDAWYPGIRDVKIQTVDAGAIVARGTTDVDDSASELHSRAAVGVWSHEGYHSLDPGKLTTAPFFAEQAADRIQYSDSSTGSIIPRQIKES